MEKIYVIYWSMSGNTQAMAEAIAKGINDSGKEAVVQYVSEVSVSELQDAKVFALGCPAMGAEVLEEGEMEPFVSEVEGIAAGKKIALFGSYGWGDGQWMRDWEERMSGCGAAIINGAGLICHETPDDAMISECENLGKQIAAE
jgi:flavodoxin short chain